jgi:GNAT superfamily N-acetyltransferase
MELDVYLSDGDEAEFGEFLRGLIRQFNNEHSPRHKEVRQPNAIRPLHVIVRNASGEAIGGLTGNTYWDWLEIDVFFIPQELRGQGLGAALLRTAEAAATERGARKSFLTTYDFQARGFYEKQGYVVVGQLEDYPPGSSYYWMRKNLGA